LSAAQQPQHNRLINEKSPYLLQHADNPVDWYPWNDEAFERAREMDKPIFLSIGYSTCHWCHVMAHESFEDHEIAQLLNESFVPIKVDREERPDIDQIYMSVCQMLTGSGGWPLTIIMTPEREPFFAGTYFPKQSAHGRIGMNELIPRVAHIWANEREEVRKARSRIQEALNEIAPTPSSFVINDALLTRAYQQLESEFDSEYGGFGRAPKFPTPHRLMFLLRHWKRTGEPNALRIVKTTLDAMARGGIRDHVGSGFHRYSTDREWLLPHFEKMLYDQALLLIAYSEAYLVTGDSQFAEIADEIISYVERELTSPEGGFYSAEDADSEGVEGKFYIWTKAESKEILGEEADLFCQVYGITSEGNFLEEATRERTGANIPHLSVALDEMAEELDMRIDELEEKLDMMRQSLFDARETRIRPHRDDKILTDWNGLMIAALAIASRALGKSQYVETAITASEFIERELVDSDGKLLHRYRDSEAGIDAFLDDYAFCIWGLLELYQSTFDTRYLSRALELSEIVIDDYWDSENAGFYFSPDSSRDLIMRMKESYDGAMPSGNSVMMSVLIKLSHLTARSEFAEKAQQLAVALGERVEQVPASHAQLLNGIGLALGPTSELVIVGDPNDSSTQAMLSILKSKFLPNTVTLFIDPQNRDLVAEMAPFTQSMEMLNNKSTAYVCVNHTCDLPTTDPKHMIELINA